jgi:hypothetical protein
MGKLGDYLLEVRAKVVNNRWSKGVQSFPEKPGPVQAIERFSRKCRAKAAEPGVDRLSTAKCWGTLGLYPPNYLWF